MRCFRCDYETNEEVDACPLCGTALDRHDVTVAVGARHVVGRIMPPTVEEAADVDSVLRADAVLALKGDVPPTLLPLESAVAQLIDGVRPVARIRKKCGATSRALRAALRDLHAQGLVGLVGIVKEAGSATRADLAAGDATRRIAEADMMISARAMAEIKEMKEEDRSTLDGDDTEPFDIKTTPEA